MRSLLLGLSERVCRCYSSLLTSEEILFDLLGQGRFAQAFVEMAAAVLVIVAVLEFECDVCV